MAQVWIAAGPIDVPEQPLFGLETPGEGGRRILGDIGALAIDDDDDGIGKLGEGALEVFPAAPVGHVLRDHVAGRGIDAEIPGGIEKRRAAERQGEQRHPKGEAPGKIDPGHQRPGQQIVHRS